MSSTKNNSLNQSFSRNNVSLDDSQYDSKMFDDSNLDEPSFVKKEDSISSEEGDEPNDSKILPSIGLGLELGQDSSSEEEKESKGSQKEITEEKIPSKKVETVDRGNKFAEDLASGIQKYQDPEPPKISR